MVYLDLEPWRVDVQMGWTVTLMINFSETEGADDWPTVRCAAVSLVHVCTFFACI